MPETPNIQNAPPKKQIYYSRTYRHLQFNLKGCAVFFLIFILPMTVALLFFYDECVYAMCCCAAWFMQKAAGLTADLITTDFIPFLGPIYYLSYGNSLPGNANILINLAVTLLTVWFFSTGRRKGKPLSIYVEISLLVHAISCIFFLLSKEAFPYTLEDYSKLYVQQQAGLWLTFLVLMGLVQGVLGRGSILYRVGIVLLLMVYSFIFGTVRYGLFLWILSRCSVIYLPIMFFSLGPFFDFLYFVMIYAAGANHMILRYDQLHKEDWKWA